MMVCQFCLYRQPRTFGGLLCRAYFRIIVEADDNELHADLHSGNALINVNNSLRSNEGFALCTAKDTNIEEVLEEDKYLDGYTEFAVGLNSGAGLRLSGSQVTEQSDKSLASTCANNPVSSSNRIAFNKMESELKDIMDLWNNDDSFERIKRSDGIEGSFREDLSRSYQSQRSVVPLEGSCSTPIYQRCRKQEGGLNDGSPLFSNQSSVNGRNVSRGEEDVYKSDNSAGKRRSDVVVVNSGVQRSINTEDPIWDESWCKIFDKYI